MRPVLGITMGDPAGIGPEVIVKALARPDVRRLCRPLVIGSAEVLTKTIRRLRAPLKLCRVQVQDLPCPAGPIPVMDPLTHPLPAFPLGRISKETGEAQARYVKEAVRLALAKNIAGIVTGPINKEAIILQATLIPAIPSSWPP